MKLDKLTIQGAALIMLISACATTPQDTNLSTYSESKIDKLNQASATFTPPKLSTNGETIDPLYMRTQADYYYSVGESYSLDGDNKKAIEAFKLTLVYDSESSAINLRLAAEYIKLGMINEAIDQAQEAIRKSPKVVNNHLLLGGLYSSMKMYDQALEQYNLVLTLNPGNTEAPLYIGAIYSEQKKHSQAISYFEKILKNKEISNAHLVHYYIGRVLVDEGSDASLKKAEKSFLYALKLKPDFADAAIVLGTLYAKNNKEEMAIELYKKFQKENSPNPKLAEALAQAYINKEDYDSAYEQLEIMENYSDDTLGIKMKMALILIEKKRFDMATAKLEEILREVPDSDKIRFYLAAVYEEVKKYDEAVVHYAKIPVSSSFFIESTAHLAYIYKNKGDLKGAISTVEKALKLKKDQPQLHALYAALLDEHGEQQNAKDFLEKSMVQFPDNTQILFYYATMNDKLGNKKTVIETLQQVIKIDPSHAQGLNYLAYSWAEENVNLAEAEKLARRALVVEPKDAYIMDTLGWILFKNGHNQEAIKYLELAYKTQSTVSIIAEHLGDVYRKTALVEKAKAMYKKAVELETDTKKIDELKAKITSIDKQKIDGGRIPASALFQK